LDTIVMDRLCNDLLTPERVARIVAEIARLREAGMDQVKTDLSQLCKQQEVYRKKLNNLMDALADGFVEAGEVFREKVKSIEADVARVTGLIEDHKRVISSRVEEITTEQAAQFADEMREKLKAASPALKKRILRSFVSEVYISNDKIAVIGRKSDMAEIVTGSIKP
jgi:site-specific DNA recombinase